MPLAQEDLLDELRCAKAEIHHLRLVPKPQGGQRSPQGHKRPPQHVGALYHRCLRHQSEIISALVGLLWGAWVGNPTFDVYAMAPELYAGSARFAAELVWGVVVFVAGLSTLVGFLWHSRVLRHVGLLGLTWIWAMGFLAAINGPSLWTTAPVSYPVLCFVACWAYMQVDD